MYACKTSTILHLNSVAPRISPRLEPLHLLGQHMELKTDPLRGPLAEAVVFLRVNGRGTLADEITNRFFTLEHELKEENNFSLILAAWLLENKSMRIKQESLVKVDRRVRLSKFTIPHDKTLVYQLEET